MSEQHIWYTTSSGKHTEDKDAAIKDEKETTGNETVVEVKVTITKQ